MPVRLGKHVPLNGSLDEEAQEDLRANKNLGTYKGAIYENMVGDMLVKQGYRLYYYNNDKPWKAALFWGGGFCVLHDSFVFTVFSFQ